MEIWKNKPIKETHFKVLKKRQAISYAQTLLRSDISEALARFNDRLDIFNIDMTADIKVDISYKRRANDTEK